MTDRLRKIGDERKRLMAALHSFVLEAPCATGFSAAVDKSDALKSNLEQEATLLQDFHIVFTCKVHEDICIRWHAHPATGGSCRRHHLGCRGILSRAWYT